MNDRGGGLDPYFLPLERKSYIYYVWRAQNDKLYSHAARTADQAVKVVRFAD